MKQITRTKGDDSISYADWLATVKAYAAEEGKDFDEAAALYSFRTAFDEGRGMLEAWADCMAWLEN